MNATVAVRSLISIAGGGAVASILGYAAMSFLNAVAHGMAASLGAHPTGQGNLESQLAAGLGVGFLGAVATSVWVLRRDALEGGPRIRVVTLGAVLSLGIVAVLLVRGLHGSRAAAAEVRRSIELIRSLALAGKGSSAQFTASTLTQSPRGVKALAELLADASAPPPARLLAGLTLVEAGVSTAEQQSAVAAMMRPPSPIRRNGIAYVADRGAIDLAGPIDTWIHEALHDPDLDVRLAALSVLDGTRWDRERDSQPCAVVLDLLRRPETHFRQAAIRTVGLCDAATARELIASALRDPDPGVRVVALSQHWRLGDSPSERASRLALLQSWLDDTDLGVRQAAQTALGRYRVDSNVAEERAYRLGIIESQLATPAPPKHRELLAEVGRWGSAQIPPEERGRRIAIVTLSVPHPDVTIRQAAFEGLIQLLDGAAPRERDAIWHVLMVIWREERDPILRRLARVQVRKLGQPTGPPAGRRAHLDASRRALRDRTPEVRLSAAEQLAWMGDASGVPVARAWLRDGDASKDERAFESAIWTLAFADGPKATPILTTLQVCHTLKPSSRATAADALAEAYLRRGQNPPTVSTSLNRWLTTAREPLLPEYCPDVAAAERILDQFQFAAEQAARADRMIGQGR